MSKPQSRETGRSRGTGFLDAVERLGNRLPDQISIFMTLGAITLVVSYAASAAGVAITHPVTGAAVRAYNLLSREGLQWIFSSLVTNFTGFAPLGVVLVAMIGIGVAERSGLFASLLKGLVSSVPARAITPTIVFAGVMSNVASDAGYVVLPPLAAMAYVAVGKHPLAGIAAAFAGVAGGFSANLLLSTLDPMLAGLTQEGARLFDPKYEVVASCNWYFLAASTFLLTGVGWYVSARIVEPRLGAWTGQAESVEPLQPIEPAERRGLWAAALVFLAVVAAIVLLTAPAGGVLRDAQTGGLKPFYASLVGLIMLAFILPGLAYAIATGKVRSDRDASRMMSHSISGMANYIVLAFFASQFIQWFNKSNLGFILAVEGAGLLRGIHLTGMPLMIAFVLLVATFNILMSSASAKWTLLAPVFVPMFMQLGHSPEVTQALYRVGDSVTNSITPLNFYMPILLAAAAKYVPDARMGTLISVMVPYALAFLAAWTLLLLIWLALDIELGPGAVQHYRIPTGAPAH
ncbi:MAG: p-aminobenzoyl-glutamate transport protein [Phycisphaerae bacterium]|nr:p-aminobenzoyl-glutamate transport protein [Phycisphaerae bacterium]